MAIQNESSMLLRLRMHWGSGRSMSLTQGSWSRPPLRLERLGPLNPLDEKPQPTYRPLSAFPIPEKSKGSEPCCMMTSVPQATSSTSWLGTSSMQAVRSTSKVSCLLALPRPTDLAPKSWWIRLLTSAYTTFPPRPGSGRCSGSWPFCTAPHGVCCAAQVASACRPGAT